jgi:hypothetical protein
MAITKDRARVLSRAQNCAAGAAHGRRSSSRFAATGCASSGGRAQTRMRLASRRSGIASASRPHTPSFLFRAPQQQQAAIRGLVAAAKSAVSFLRRTDGRSKGSRVASVMSAVALGSQLRDATRLNTDLLRESRVCCYSRHINLVPDA